MVGVGGKRACTLGMQSLYWGFISFHISLSHAHSIEFEGACLLAVAASVMPTRDCVEMKISGTILKGSLNGCSARH